MNGAPGHDGVIGPVHNSLARCRSQAILCGIVLAVGVRWQVKAEQLPPALNISKNTDVTCYDTSSKFVGSRRVRTPEFLSPDGRRRAYVELEALGLKGRTAEWWPECVNTSKLFVARSENDGFTLVFLQEPDRWHLLNSIELVDWSPHGRYLLFNLFIGQYGSDFGGVVVRLYDAEDGVFTEEELTHEAFSKYIGKDCPAVIRAIGFSPDDKVVLRAGPYFNEETPDEGSCVKKEGFWLLDSHKITVNPLPDGYRVQSYGKFTDNAGRK